MAFESYRITDIHTYMGLHRPTYIVTYMLHAHTLKITSLHYAAFSRSGDQ